MTLSPAVPLTVTVLLLAVPTPLPKLLDHPPTNAPVTVPATFTVFSLALPYALIPPRIAPVTLPPTVTSTLFPCATLPVTPDFPLANPPAMLLPTVTSPLMMT